VAAPEFHTLVVDAVTALTDDAAAIDFVIPPELETEFEFVAGQHVTVRAEIGGEDVRRSYSICTPPGSHVVRIGVKQIPDGAFSTHAVSQIAPGDQLDVMAPVGDFTAEPDAERARRYGAIAAGSGITPVLSIISAVLDIERDSRVTLLFGNRASNTIMFLEDLAALKDRFADRFHVVHVLSREPQLVELFHGRLDSERLEALFEAVIDPDSVDEWYLCGPFSMVMGERGLLEARGVNADRINDELFFSEDIPEIEITAAPEAGAHVTFTLDGRSSVVPVDPDGPSILDHALQLRRELPFACGGWGGAYAPPARRRS
jgi:ring-1,2-phenylacetyl-CoA epoxidase subunit PaaE